MFGPMQTDKVAITAQGYVVVCSPRINVRMLLRFSGDQFACKENHEIRWCKRNIQLHVKCYEVSARSLVFSFSSLVLSCNARSRFA